MASQDGLALRIGIDVGGTNTDAVLMQGDAVLSSSKQATTADVTAGVVAAIEAVLSEGTDHRRRVKAVMVGTTHFVNAIVQCRSLRPVAALRIGLPMGSAIPPMVDWPDSLRKVVDGGVHLVRGGCYYTGDEYVELDQEAVKAAARAARQLGVDAIAISSVFAPIRPDVEERAAALVRGEHPDARITLSNEIGGLGLIERENSALLNACLSSLADSVVDGLQSALRQCGLEASLFVSHNDGTLLDVEQVRRFPVFACSAGPTNSIRGAAFLTGLSEAVVVDVGGTTTDVGMLSKGLARETSAAIELGGVKTNFAMPDVLSIALGGGTRILDSNGSGLVLGTESVGYRLREDARVFGGNVLTATDIAVAQGWMQVDKAQELSGLSDDLMQPVIEQMQSRMADAVDQVKLSAADIPVVAVGGGAPLVRDALPGADTVHRPEFAGVANAIGAAIAQVGGRYKRLSDYKALGGRDAAIAAATEEAKAAALAQGAIPDTLHVVEVEEFPMPYMETDAVDLRVRVVGDLAFESGAKSR